MSIFPLIIIAGQKDAKLTLFEDNFSKTIDNKELTGGFLEFLNHYINGSKGLSAQEFYDRGMDWQNQSFTFSKHWAKIDESEDIDYGINSGGYNQNGTYFTFMKNTSDVFKGAEQEVILNDSVSHNFYVYAKTPSYSNLEIRIVSDSQIIYSKDFGIISDNWTKYETIIPPLKGYHKVKFQIGNRDGILHLDETSLMPTNHINGMRKEMYKMLEYWKPGMLRYPGGCFADFKDVLLENCIGEVDQRKAPLLGWPPASQRMDWGADEFLQFCEALEIEPHITVNYENGTPSEAAAWVEYCNGDTNTYYGKLRAKNGHPEPYDVKYFEIGNEQWHNQDKYVRDYVHFYDAMKEIDPDIIILIDGNHWNGTADIEKLYGIVGKKTNSTVIILLLEENLILLLTVTWSLNHFLQHLICMKLMT